jgi:hypothetical protein
VAYSTRCHVGDLWLFSPWMGFLDHAGSHYPVPTVVVHVQRGSFSQKCSGRTAQVAALLAQRLDVVLCALIAGEVADATVGVNPREQVLQGPIRHPPLADRALIGR